MRAIGFLTAVMSLLIVDLSFSESVKLETILQKMDRGFTLSAQREKKDGIPGERIIDEVKESIATRIQDGDFPIVQQGSKVDEDLSKIFESVLSLSGFEKGGFKYQLILDLDASAFCFLPEKIELDFLKTIEEALQIEPLIPEEDKIEQIQNQVRALKKGLTERVFALFNELPENWINESVSLSFMRFELGSRSVMSVWAKNVLDKDQVECVLKKWDSLLNRENDIVVEISNTENDVVKKSKLLRFVFDLTKEISEQYRLLLSLYFQNPPEQSQRWIELNNLFSSVISKERNLNCCDGF